MTLVDRESPINQAAMEANDECESCDGCDRCDEINPLHDVHGNSMDGLLPLFSAPDLDTLHQVLHRMDVEGYKSSGGTLPDGRPALGILNSMLDNQDIMLFMDLGQIFQGWVNEALEATC